MQAIQDTGIGTGDEQVIKKVLSYTIIRIKFKVLHKFYEAPEPKDNKERNPRDQMSHFITLWSYGRLSSLTLNPFSETKFYEVNEFVFKI